MSEKFCRVCNISLGENFSSPSGFICKSCYNKISTDNARLRLKERKFLGVCFTCKNPLDGKSPKYCVLCRESGALRHRVWRESARKNGLCTRCGTRKPIESPSGKIKTCMVCLEKRNKYRKSNRGKRNYLRAQLHVKLVKEVFDAYGGPVCNCCGETEIKALVLDHKNNDGAKHRRECGEGAKMYNYLKKKGFPKDLGIQVLCANCNTIKLRNNGVCVHSGYKKEDFNYLLDPISSY